MQIKRKVILLSNNTRIENPWIKANEFFKYICPILLIIYNIKTLSG